MSETNALNVLPGKYDPCLGFLLPIYGKGVRPNSNVEFVVTELAAGNIQNFLALMNDLADYDTQLPGRTKLTFENARARYCPDIEGQQTEQPEGPANSLLQKWSRCALKAGQQTSKGQWIGTHVLKQFQHVQSRESICHVTKNQVSWESAPGRKGGRIYTGALDKTLLLAGLLAMSPAEAISKLFQQLLQEDIQQAIQVLEKGARPQFGQHPEKRLLKHLDRDILTGLQTHPNRSVRKRTMRILSEL